ncbi:MAG: tail fiber domain-containing protein [Terriglobales bacterium]
MKLRAVCVMAFLSLVLSLNPLTVAQTSTQTVSALPRLVRFGGAVKDLNGTALTGVVGVTFALYSEPTGGAPLWLETQNVQADRNGRYTVLLGSTKPDGLPAELFTSGQARWVGVQVSGQAEQPRVLLVSAPYALKAGDAETIGGLPPSAFVLAAPLAISSATASSTVASTAESVSPATTSDVTTTGGTVNAIPLFSTATNIQNSILTQTSTKAVNVGGKLNLPATAAATKTAGTDSRPLDFVASSFSSTTSTPVSQTFQWQAEPAANNTASPSGTLNLLYGLGPAAPAETGLKLSSKGIFAFAAGQTFPGTGDGTVTSVATGLGLNGGPITKTGTLTIDTTKIPQLAAANTFTGNQTVNGNLSATGLVTGSGFQIGSNLFAFGSYTNSNAFLGFAGNSTTTGVEDTASGVNALFSNSTGSENTASGDSALFSNSTGGSNTATGSQALKRNTVGSANTASGFKALYNSNAGIENTAVGALAGAAAGPPSASNDDTFVGYNAQGTANSNATAIGANAMAGATNSTAIGANANASAANSLVLGSIKGINGATASTSVGIGTTAPLAALDVAGNQVETVIGDPGCGAGFAGIAFSGKGFSGFDSCLNYSLVGDGDNTYINAAFGNIYFRSRNKNTVFIGFNGGVGINTTTPDEALSVNGGADKPGGGSWGTFSDGRLKTLNGSFNSGLSQVLKIHPVRYRYKPDNAMGIRDTNEHIGVVAQEVQRVIPEAVTENSKGYLLVNNDPIIWSMLNAIKEQQGAFRREHAELVKALHQIKQQRSLLRAQTLAMRSLETQVHETRETLRKVKAQVAATQPAVVAAK